MSITIRTGDWLSVRSTPCTHTHTHRYQGRRVSQVGWSVQVDSGNETDGHSVRYVLFQTRHDQKKNNSQLVVDAIGFSSLTVFSVCVCDSLIVCCS